MKLSHKDFLGKEINIGDEVVFMRQGYRELIRGVIFHETPKTISIYDIDERGWRRETKQFPCQCVKIITCEDFL